MSKRSYRIQALMNIAQKDPNASETEIRKRLEDEMLRWGLSHTARNDYMHVIGAMTQKW